MDSLTVTLNGFWSEFAIKNIPDGVDLYLVFAGRKIRDGRCHIDRLLYVDCAASEVASLLNEEIKKRLDACLQPGEILYFAVGSSMGEKSVAVKAIEKQFSAAVDNVGITTATSEPTRIVIDGKIPRIFDGKNTFMFRDNQGSAEVGGAQ